MNQKQVENSSRYPSEMNSEIISPELSYCNMMKPPSSSSIQKSKTKKMKIKVMKNDGTASRIIELGDGQKRIFRSA